MAQSDDPHEMEQFDRPGPSCAPYEDYNLWEPDDADGLDARLSASIIMPRGHIREATQGMVYNETELQRRDDDDWDEAVKSSVVIPLEEVR